jgi:hypothetical protein
MEISDLRRVFVFNPVVEPRTSLHVGEAPKSTKKRPILDFWARGDGRDFCVNPVVKSSTRLHVGADFFLRFGDGRDFFLRFGDGRDFCVNPVVKPRTSLGWPRPPGLGGKRCAGFLC